MIMSKLPCPFFHILLKKFLNLSPFLPLGLFHFHNEHQLAYPCSTITTKLSALIFPVLTTDRARYAERSVYNQAHCIGS